MIMQSPSSAALTAFLIVENSAGTLRIRFGTFSWPEMAGWISVTTADPEKVKTNHPIIKINILLFIFLFFVLQTLSAYEDSVPGILKNNQLLLVTYQI